MAKHREEEGGLYHVAYTYLQHCWRYLPLGEPPNDLPLPIKDLEPTVLESSNSSVSFLCQDYRLQPDSGAKMVAVDSVPWLQIGVDTRQVNDKWKDGRTL